MRILLVKLSSMGDVIHNLPVVSDLAHAFPGAIIDWVTESAYAGLVRLHPGVANVLTLNLRALKKQWWAPSPWQQLQQDLQVLRETQYDAVLDTQGLVKSALIARWTHGPRYGLSHDTAREPFAARFYQHHFVINKHDHAVTRNRKLAAAALGYTMREPLDYGISGVLPQTPRPAWLSGQRYIVMLHATSRADKQWPTQHWVALGKQLQALGYTLVIPWGGAAEKKTSESLAALLTHAAFPVTSPVVSAIVPPALALTEAAGLLAGASVVVGVDTGLAHLAVALGRPTVGLYISTSAALTGLFGSPTAINLGGGSRESPANPSVDEAFRAIQPWLS